MASVGIARDIFGILKDEEAFVPYLLKPGVKKVAWSADLSMGLGVVISDCGVTVTDSFIGHNLARFLELDNDAIEVIVNIIDKASECPKRELWYECFPENGNVTAN